jgi:hypothetical protein
MGYFQPKELTNMKWEKFVELVTNYNVLSRLSIYDDQSDPRIFNHGRIHHNPEKQTVGFYNGPFCFPLLRKIFNDDIHKHHTDENTYVLYYQEFYQEPTGEYETVYMNDGGEEQREVMKTLETYDLKPVYFKFYNIMEL